ncbi:hypothetical protein [Streptomyces cyaneofuscatus]|uniref:hypothetical protein n=1 Tax=Streptomyces cyaneofuscatus TaxID=66883 RepID=UPI0036DE4239
MTKLTTAAVTLAERSAISGFTTNDTIKKDEVTAATTATTHTATRAAPETAAILGTPTQHPVDHVPLKIAWSFCTYGVILKEIILGFPDGCSAWPRLQGTDTGNGILDAAGCKPTKPVD